MTTARTVAQVIAAEAVSGTPEQRLADMRAIASVIANRAQQLGVSMEDVVAYQPEFNAYGQTMPPGTSRLVDMAQEAIDYVAENGPTTSATYYATPRSAPNLPNDLSYETETAGHQFFSDPHGRAIRTGRRNDYAEPLRLCAKFSRRPDAVLPGPDFRRWIHWQPCGGAAGPNARPLGPKPRCCASPVRDV